MNKESLKIVQEQIIDLLDNINIPTHEKIELLINLLHFLNPEKYEENIKTLSNKK